MTDLQMANIKFPILREDLIDQANRIQITRG